MELLSRIYELNRERAKLSKQVRILEETEKKLIDELLKTHKDSFIESGYAVNIARTEEPFVDHWPSLMAHIKETGDIDLFEKRLLKSAAKLRLEEGVTLPGVITVEKTKVSVELTKERA